MDPQRTVNRKDDEEFELSRIHGVSMGRRTARAYQLIGRALYLKTELQSDLLIQRFRLRKVVVRRRRKEVGQRPT